MSETRIRSTAISICWFRRDLRISDNPALFEAANLGKILPIYILDSSKPHEFRKNSASKIYLHHSLESLNQSLNGNLNLYVGDPETVIFQLIKNFKVENIFWNRSYEDWQAERDRVIKNKLADLKINYGVFNGTYLWQPEEVKKEDGSFYKVFSAYKRKLYYLAPRKTLPKPEELAFIRDNNNKTALSDFQLIPNHDWSLKIMQHWNFGETAAQNKLYDFLENSLSQYKNGRDYPSYGKTSNLSANLHFGEISPSQVWEAVDSIGRLKAPAQDVEHFLSEMIWREFSCYLMFYFKKLHTDNFQTKFNNFPWQYNDELFNAWKMGKTGYPIIDAGMRELWQTGYMHNRIRMIVASFLVKNLMIHWHYGRDWFWDCLIDADLANNSASWQWVAGCGVDAAPYFRIFNPILQGEKFDCDGIYTKKFVPELRNLPNKYLFKPWEAPEKILKDAKITLGVNYPKPIVNLALSRTNALGLYKNLSLKL